MTQEIAKVVGLDLPISTKYAIEVANFVRYKNIQTAKKQLQLVIDQELAIPLKRFHKDRGHRKGEHIAQGSYPKKTSQHILKLINSLEANARNKGMDTELIYVAEIIANKAAGRFHSGRNRGKMKSTNIKIIAKEKKQKKVEKKPKKEEKK